MKQSLPHFGKHLGDLRFVQNAANTARGLDVIFTRPILPSIVERTYMIDSSSDQTADRPGRRAWPRIVAAVLLVATIVVVGVLVRDELQLAKLVQYESKLRILQREQPILVYGTALLIYVTATALSIPIATGLSLLYGWYFGFWRGVVVVSFGSTAGATLAFLISRYLLREIVQRRFGDRLQRFNAELEREGAFYLFTLRLLPMVPFFVVNAVMRLTPLRTRTFWWVSQLGMLPATMIYLYAGSTAPNLSTLADRGVSSLPVGRITVALMLLGLFPLVVRTVVRRLQRNVDHSRPETGDQVDGP